MSGSESSKPQAYLVGAGIAALASAAYLIRDGAFAGKGIHVLEEASVLGGSLDGAGSPDSGYVIWGGRMTTSSPNLSTSREGNAADMRAFGSAYGVSPKG